MGVPLGENVKAKRENANKIILVQCVCLWKKLSKKRHTEIIALFVLMILSAVAEIVSIGSVIPFLGSLTAPERLFVNPYMGPVILFFGYDQPAQLILPLTIFFVTAALLAGLLRLLLLVATTRISFATGADIGLDIYKRTLYQTYEVHTTRNSSELVNGIVNKTNTVIYGILMPALTLISSIVMLVSIMAVLVVLEPLIAISAVTIIGGIYVAIILLTRRRLESNSKCIADQSTILIKSLQEGLGGIRDILIDGSQELFCKMFHKADKTLRKAQGDVHIISGSPRFIIETIVMLLIAGVAYSLTKDEDGLIHAIPMLGALALGAQRLLPVFQQGYSSISGIKAGKESLVDVLALLNQKMPDIDEGSSIKPLSFEKEIKFNAVGFRYGTTQSWVLQDIDLAVRKGSCVGFIGQTGGGKTTLLDILMGLLAPTTGFISVDGIKVNRENIDNWQSHIAHVPQNIYLSDSSLLENIAYGVSEDKIDHVQVERAVIDAQLHSLIEKLPDGYMTHVGERGARLSGGQRQRIGIARALYRNADVIVFDEATSALDNETEKAIMKAISNLQKGITVFIIAHRLTTLKYCDQIFELREGKLLSKGDYKDFISK